MSAGWPVPIKEFDEIWEISNKEEFAYEFRLQTIQRCLKAAGTFSYQSVNRGKSYFIPFIKPMLRISIRSAESLGRFPQIRRILGPLAE